MLARRLGVGMWGPPTLRSRATPVFVSGVGVRQVDGFGSICPRWWSEVPLKPDPVLVVLVGAALSFFRKGSAVLLSFFRKGYEQGSYPPCLACSFFRQG